MDDIRKVQHCFAVKAGAQPKHRFGHLYRYLWREEWLNAALEKVLRNPGSRTPGVDGMTKEQLKTPKQKRELVSFSRKIAKGLDKTTFEHKRRFFEILQVQGVVTPIEGGHEINGSWLIPKQEWNLTVTSAARCARCL